MVLDNKKGIKVGGISKGVISAATWGIDTVLMGVILSMAPFVGDGEAIFLAPFVSAFLHDLFSSIWTIMFLVIKRQIPQLLKAMKTKSARYVILGGILGGPIGMTGYYLAIKYIGPSYTAIISSIYPAVGAILAAVVLKEKVNKKAWAGLLLSISGIIALGYSSDASSFSLIGVLFALVCVIGWGTECVVCAYGMKDGEVDSSYALQIRQITSSLSYGIILVPILGGIGLTIDVTSSTTLIWIGGTALFGTISYLCYYSAINQIGATKAMGLNITYVVWALVFDLIVRGTELSVKTILCAIIVAIGSFIVAKQPTK